MPKGGYYIEADTRAFVDELKRTEHGIRDLKAAYREMATWIERDVAKHVPVYGGQHSRAKAGSKSHDGAGHPAPGNLLRTLRSGATQTGPYVRVGGPEAPYAQLQEFGGTSFWHRGKEAKFHGFKAGARARGYFTTSYRGEISKHTIYKKQRSRYGYFIWNAGYHLRDKLGRWFYEAIRDVAAKHSIPIEVPANTSLDIRPQARNAA